MESSSAIDTFKAQFEKKITFCQLYDVFNHNKQYMFNRKISQWACLCEICENALFLDDGINKTLFPHKPVATFSYSDTEDCMIGEYNKCSSTKLSSNNFNTRCTSDSDSTSPTNVSDVDRENKNVQKDYVSYCE